MAVVVALQIENDVGGGWCCVGAQLLYGGFGWVATGLLSSSECGRHHAAVEFTLVVCVWDIL